MECRVIRLTRSLACEIKKHTSKSTTGSPNNPAFPARRFYDLFRALSGDRAFCHRPRCDAEHRHQVNASVEAPRPHGFVVRETGAFVCCAIRGHRIPHPTFVTIAKRPSDRARDGRKGARDLPVVASEVRATDWHDGQITFAREMLSTEFRQRSSFALMA